MLHRFQKQFPEVRIETEINNSSIIEQRVLDNAIDIGLIENQPEHGDICAVPFMQDELARSFLRASAGQTKKSNAGAAGRSAVPDAGKGSAGREILDAAFELLQKKIHPVMESVSTQAIVKGVSEGLGVAVLPYLLVRRDIEEGVVEQVPLAEPIERNLNIIYHKSKYLTGNMNAFMELCKQYGEETDHE
ncbi:MAG: LysR substrate-binding domain-containing protein [Anaerosacchariphilus sp.]